MCQTILTLAYAQCSHKREIVGDEARICLFYTEGKDQFHITTPLFRTEEKSICPRCVIKKQIVEGMKAEGKSLPERELMTRTDLKYQDTPEYQQEQDARAAKAKSVSDVRRLGYAEKTKLNNRMFKNVIYYVEQYKNSAQLKCLLLRAISDLPRAFDRPCATRIFGMGYGEFKQGWEAREVERIATRAGLLEPLRFGMATVRKEKAVTSAAKKSS
ncbi:hypothetical protein F5Y18DRAFT_444973 [Xylariaceae sp. FL1019]|nr:hypothetical protein F5Y18DRAFT_444973 [Xylariaceae sp. FL1019]